MDIFKRLEKAIACGGYGWHWYGSHGRGKPKTLSEIRKGVKRTARRKLKQSGYEESDKMLKW